VSVFKDPKSKLILYGSAPKADGTYPVYLRVTYRGKRKYFSTGVDGAPKQWNLDKERFKSCRPKCKNRDCESCRYNQALDGFMSEYHNTIATLRKIYPEFNFGEFRGLLTGGFDASAGSVLSVIEMKLKEVQEGIKNGTAGVGTYNNFINTRNALELFLEAKGNDNDLSFAGMDYDFLKAFERYLRSKDRKIYVWMGRDNKRAKKPARKALSTTSVGAYMKNLRTIWNLAKKKKLTQGLDYPFGSGSYTIKSGTPNRDNYRHLTADEINTLIAFQSQIKDPTKHESLLLWLAMFYSNGANMADLCRWKWEENVKPVGKGLFQVWYKRTKNRSKENQPEANIIDPNLSVIIKFFADKTNPSPYVFPILLHAWVRNKGKLSDNQITGAYRCRNRKIIYHMRALCKEVGIERPELVDVYCCRHSFACAEYQSTKDVLLVSKKLLHTNLVTTARYLESLGQVVRLQASKASEMTPFHLMQVS